MGNFYEYENRFILIDVEGVLLEPLEELIIREPENAGEKITLERSSNHGVDFEFSGSENPLGFDRVKMDGQDYSGFDLLKAIKQISGVDGKCVYQILNRNKTSGVYEIQYSGNIDFMTYDEQDYKISILSRRINLGDTFRTRIDTVVSMSSSETIDGSAITPLVPDSIFLHSKSIEVIQNAKSDTDFDFIEMLETGTNEYYLQLDYLTKQYNGEAITGYLNQLERDFGNGVFTNLFLSSDFISPHYTTKKSQFGVMKMVYEASYGLVLTNMNGYTVEYLGTFVRYGKTGIEVRINDPITFVLDSTFYSCDIDFSYNGSFNLEDEDNFYIYDKWEFDLSGAVTQTRRIVPATGHEMNLTFLSTTDSSTADAYKPFNVLERILEGITGSDGIVISNFFETIAPEMYLTNGYLVRNFETALHPFKISFSDFFNKWAHPTFGLGYAVVNDGGDFKLMVERYSEFYTNNEIIYIESIVDGSLFISVDAPIIFNEIEIGYSEIPKNTDENKSNNLDEFNTLHKLITPIEMHKSKEDYISDVIASGYIIESQRQEQFADVPKDTVSYDEKTFVISSINSDTYDVKRLPTDPTNNISSDDANFIFLQGTFFDIRVGDVIGIATATASTYDGESYTIELVEYVGEKTRILVTETTINAGYSGDWTLTLPESRLRAKRNEELDVLDNVLSPHTVYNVGLNPKYMLFNHSPILNSGFNPKLSTAKIKTQDNMLGSEMACQFSSGEGGYILDPDRVEVSMNGELTLSQMNQYGRLFTGQIIKFRANLSFEEIIAIKDAYQNVGNADFMGFIRIKISESTDLCGFLMSMSYNTLSEDTEFVLREKY